jgi:hypothetical protein
MATTVNSLVGATKADAERHVIARSVLLEQLANDPRVAPTLDRVLHGSAIVALRDDHLQAIAALRAAAGELLGSDAAPVDPGAWSRLPEEQRERLLGLVRRQRKASKKYKSAAGRFGRTVGRVLLILFRDTLKLTPQLAHDLLADFLTSVLSADQSDQHRLRFRVVVPAPPLTVMLETRDNEDCDEAIERFTTQYLEAVFAIHTYGARLTGKGKSPSSEDAKKKVVRNAMCYYRKVLRGENVSDLAREYGEYRQTIQHGIRETRRLLFELPAMTFRKPKRRAQK